MLFTFLLFLFARQGNAAPAANGAACNAITEPAPCGGGHQCTLKATGELITNANWIAKCRDNPALCTCEAQVATTANCGAAGVAFKAACTEYALGARCTYVGAPGLGGDAEAKMGALVTSTKSAAWCAVATNCKCQRSETATEVTTLKGTDAAATLTALKAQVTALNPPTITAIDDKLSVQTTALKGNGAATITTVDEAIANLKGVDPTATANTKTALDIAGVQKHLTAVETETAAIITDIAEVKTDTTALTAKVDELAKTLKKLETKIDDENKWNVHLFWMTIIILCFVFVVPFLGPLFFANSQAQFTVRENTYKGSSSSSSSSE